MICITVLSGCGGRDPLIGQWQEPISGVTMDIDKDGDLVMGLHGTSFKMTYLLEDPNVMIFKASTDGSIPDQRMTYQVNEDVLIITVDGVDTTFYRLK